MERLHKACMEIKLFTQIFLLASVTFDVFLHYSKLPIVSISEALCQIPHLSLYHGWRLDNRIIMTLLFISRQIKKEQIWEK